MGERVPDFSLRDQNGRTWTLVKSPVVQNTTTSGITSVAFFDQHRGLIVGGDLNTSGPVRPDRIASGELDSPTRKLWFDPQAFRRVSCNIPSRPDLCRYGSAGYNILDAPGQSNLDFSLFKNFNITETTRVQFRTEFVNAFNTPYFGQPNGIGFTANDVIVPDGTRMGEIRSLRTPMRIIQFGLKLYF